MTKLKLKSIAALILLTLGMISATSGAVAAQDTSPGGPVVLTDQQGEYPLGRYLDILEDPGGKLTIEDVSSPEYSEKFVPSQTQVPVFGFTDSTYWVRINFVNDAQQTSDWLLDVLYSNLHYVDLYTPLPNNQGFAIKQSGSARPPTTRDIRYPRVVFTLLIPSQSQETIYMRFQSGTSMTLNLKLWSTKTFVNRSIYEQIGFGLFFGILIGLLLYNLSLLFAWKELSYFYFVLLLASLLLHEASYNGYLETYVIPGLYYLKIYYHPMLYALMITSMMLFADMFLKLKKQLPMVHWVTLVSASGFGILILLIPFVSYRIIAILMVYWTFFSLLTLVTGWFFNFLRERFRPPPLFMLAWFCLVALLLDVLLVRVGITPSTFLNENTYRLGILLVAILWSISLADRVKLLKLETENANRNLRNSEHQLSQILDSMPLGVVLYTSDYKPKYANQSSFEILSNPNGEIRPDLSAGRTVSEAIEYYSIKPTGSTEPYPLENYPAINALHGKPAYADDIEMHRGEQIIPLEMWASPILDESGNVESAVVVFQDISHRKMAENLLTEYHKRLEFLVEERTADLNATNRELHLRLEWLAAVNFVNQMIARSANFTEIHGTIVEIIKHLFAVQDSFIAQLDTEDKNLRILAHSGSKSQPDLIGSSTSLPDYMQLDTGLKHGSISMISKEEFGALNGPMGNHIQISEAQSIAVVPVQVREKILGLLGLEMKGQGRLITNEEFNLLGIFSTDIAQLIEDARLFEQAKLLVAADERNRLARELHDSVAQTLYSISLFINATRLALDANKPEVVKGHLEELTLLAREAMSDMRLLIFELRPPILDKSGLAAALQSRLESVEAKAGFEAHFESEGVFQLSPAQEGELYGIAQEALNNISKHAQANQVRIHLTGQSGWVRMTIEDDGVGFDPASVEHGGGQGFRNMHERAAKIGAHCSVESNPGQGTKITIEVNE